MTYQEILNKIEEKANAAGVLLDAETPNAEEANKLLAEVKSLRELADSVKQANEAKATVKAEKAALEAAKKAPPTDAPGLQVTKDAADNAIEKGPLYKSMGAFLLDVKDHADDIGSSPRLRSINTADGFNVAKAIGIAKVGNVTSAKKAISGMSELVPADGGLLVGTDRDTSSIMARIYNTGQLLARIPTITISATSNGLSLFADAETSRRTGSRRGGVRGYWAAEGDEKTKSKPTLREITFKLNKLIALVYMTDELLADTTALESYVMQVLPEELRFLAENSIIRGTGAGQPDGVVGHAGTVSIAAEVGQAAATLVAENVINMWARRWVGSTDYIWLINQDVLPQLMQMSLAVGTGGQLVYMPPGGLSAAPYATLNGRPLLELEYCSTLGTVGDIILFSPMGYQMIDKGGIQTASSIHVRFIFDEQVFRFVMRLDGKPLHEEALTPFQGNNTVSPFVTVATRP